MDIISDNFGYYIMVAVAVREIIKLVDSRSYKTALVVLAMSFVVLGIKPGLVGFSWKDGRSESSASEGCEPASFNLGARANFEEGTTPCDDVTDWHTTYMPIATKTSNASAILMDNNQEACLKGSMGHIFIKLPWLVELRSLTVEVQKSKETTPKEIHMHGSAHNDSGFKHLMSLDIAQDRKVHHFEYTAGDRYLVQYVRLEIRSNYGGSKTSLRRFRITGSLPTSFSDLSSNQHKHQLGNSRCECSCKIGSVV